MERNLGFGILETLAVIVKDKNGKYKWIELICSNELFFCSDKSELPDTNLHLFFSDGGYKVYGINKQFVPRKLSLSFDIKTFDENSLIYLAMTVSKNAHSCDLQYQIIFLGKLSTICNPLFGKWIC